MSERPPLQKAKVESKNGTASAIPRLENDKQKGLSASLGGPIAEKRRSRIACLQQPLHLSMYRMMIRQLYHDGYLAAACAVAEASGIYVPSIEEDGNRLKDVVSKGLALENIQNQDTDVFKKEAVVERHISNSKIYIPLALSESWAVGQKVLKMQERFATSSLGGSIRNIRFSPDGSLLACSGSNGLAAIFSLKTLEDLTALEEVRQENAMRALDGTNSKFTSRNASNKITELSLSRRFNEQTQSVETIQFHPNKPIILTGGISGDIFIYDYSQPISTVILKRTDAYPVRSASFHPSGEYVLYATDHTAPRLLNLQSQAVMAPQRHNEDHHNPHAAGLCAVEYSSDGRYFLTSSLDGSWILADAVSGRNIYKAERAHSGVPVTSIHFSRTGGIVLTAGMDSVARLWDIRKISSMNMGSMEGTIPYGRRATHFSNSCEVQSFGEPSKSNHRSISAFFSFDESHILCHDASLFAVHGYAVYTGETSFSLTVPNHMQKGFAPSPYMQFVVTGGDDCRMRLWTPFCL